MTKRLWKQIVLAGISGMMILSIWGCGNSQEPAGADTRVENTEDPDGGQTEEPVSGQDTTSDEGGSGHGESPEDTAGQDRCELNGNVMEIMDGRFVITENEIEEMEDGLISIGPAFGTDGSGFREITIIYDEETRFYIRKIYDGGGRYEDEEASAEDLEKDMLVEIRGTYEGEEFHAKEVELVKVQ